MNSNGRMARRTLLKTRAAGVYLAVSKYIVVDTFARAVRTGEAKAAVEWGAEQLKRIYT